MTRTLIVTLDADTEADLERAENRIWDGLKYLHPHVPYTIEEQKPIDVALQIEAIDRPSIDALLGACERGAYSS
jgi:hypothetical protein